MHIKSFLLAFLFGVSLIVAPQARAQLAEPVITAASFDANGKLLVQVRHEGIEGCYLTVNGGRTRTSLETAIVSIQISAAQASRGKAKIVTRRRYYCPRRTLYVNVELVCVNSIVGQTTSAVKTVKVPAANLRR